MPDEPTLLALKEPFSDADMVAYLTAAFETGQPDVICRAISTVAGLKGFPSDPDPSPSTMLDVVKALGLRLKVTSIHEGA